MHEQRQEQRFSSFCIEDLREDQFPLSWHRQCATTLGKVDRHDTDSPRKREPRCYRSRFLIWRPQVQILPGSPHFVPWKASLKVHR